MNGWPAGVQLPLSGEIAIYDSEEYRANPESRRPMILLWRPEEDVAVAPGRAGVTRSKNRAERTSAVVPIAEIERYFYRGCGATWSGLDVGLGPHGSDDVTIYYARDPSVAAARGMIGNQYDGFHLEVPFSELQDIVAWEEERALWSPGLLRPWPAGADLPRVGLLAQLRGREFFAGIHPHDPIVHLLMSAAELAAFSDPAEISRDKPRSAAPRATVPRRSVDRLLTRRMDATWNGIPVGVRPDDHRTVTIYYDADPTIHMLPGMAGSRDTEIYRYVTLPELRNVRITEKDIPLWHPALEDQPR
ncbi:hypothetical protein [Cellulomonas soli]|uniref:Uncharacterized protein n=1 Tax=Cellulomonas soli TaxID=931535 RepID=A0A512PF58_9CELL|nr:hypothetical protein [Cellulomonas soli]NYI59396.1 hypothetical protein [Cellulomonas soli]GEP69813.1 hypothetical protein CSO01_25280 [Cellulomonas soli]